MSQTQQDQPRNGLSPGLEPWEMTPVQICLLHYREDQPNSVYLTQNIPRTNVNSTRTPGQVLAYLETLEDYRRLLAPDYFSSFPQRMPMIWPVSEDMSFSEDSAIYNLDDLIWDRDVVETYLDGAERRGEERVLYLYFVMDPDAMSTAVIEAITAGAGNIDGSTATRMLRAGIDRYFNVAGQNGGSHAP